MGYTGERERERAKELQREVRGGLIWRGVGALRASSTTTSNAVPGAELAPSALSRAFVGVA